MTAKQAASLIEKAVSPTVVLGTDPEKNYKALAFLVHPDRATAALGKDRAEKAFAKLSTLYASLNGKTVSNAVILGDWIVEGAFAKGDICDLYRVTHKDGRQKAILKIARSAVDNDLLTTEAATLGALQADKLADTFKVYVPRLLNNFVASGRQANVVPLADGYYSLADIKGIYSGGVDFRHCIWFMNRLLSALGFAHRNGICHGAVLPEHLLYHPEGHGLVLVDWCYSVKPGETIKARVKNREGYYPPEVGRKSPALASTDIYMAASAIMSAAVKPLPRRFMALFDHCLAQSPKARPQDAWELQDRWQELSREEYGKPKYLKLDLKVV